MPLAYGYIRVSGFGQVSGDGPERQEKAIRDFATLNCYEVAEVFSEPITGKSDLDGRAEFQRMRSALLSGTIKTVIIEKLDRLARDLMIQESFIADLQRNGIELISTFEPGLCSVDPTRVLMRQIIGAFAQYERAIIVSRTRSARERLRARNIRCEGAAPYGYRVVGPKGGKSLHVDNLEQGVIEHIRSARRAGLGLESIASQLNHLGIKPRRGKLWYAAQVQRILSRPTLSLP